MKSKQMILAVLAALVVVTGMLGCKKDDTAVKALQELTNQQLEAVKTANTELTQLAEGIESCQAEVAKTKGEAAIIKTKEVALETPELVGEASVESLNALKAALAETTKKQTTAMSELKAAQEACAADLTEAKEAAEAAAADAAAEAEAAAAAEAEAAAKDATTAAKRKAAAARAKKKAAEAEAKAKAEAPKPSKAVKEAQEQGKPTKGMGSRY
ncbi:MAG: hypothetical protein WCB63_02140 [Polyangiales bacterium]